MLVGLIKNPIIPLKVGRHNWLSLFYVIVDSIAVLRIVSFHMENVITIAGRGPHISPLVVLVTGLLVGVVFGDAVSGNPGLGRLSTARSCTP